MFILAIVFGHSIDAILLLSFRNVLLLPTLEPRKHWRGDENNMPMNFLGSERTVVDNE